MLPIRLTSLFGLTLVLCVMTSSAASAQESPLLGGIIKIPGYYPGKPIAPAGSIPVIPLTPDNSPGWFTRWNYPSFRSLPFTQYNTYQPRYVPIHNHRHHIADY